MTHELAITAVTACGNCPLRELDVFKGRNQSEVAFIERFKDGEQLAPAGSTILSRGNAQHQALHRSVRLGRSATAPWKGARRQIINYALPGDFLGLQATLDDAMSHGIEALSDVTLCHFDREKLWTLYVDHPRLAFDMTWIAARQERSFEEQLLTLGQRSAFERIAYLLVAPVRPGPCRGACRREHGEPADPAAAYRRHAGPIAGPHQQDSCRRSARTARSTSRIGRCTCATRPA